MKTIVHVMKTDHEEQMKAMSKTVAALTTPAVRNGSETRNRTMNPAAFEPTERNAVVGVGAPW